MMNLNLGWTGLLCLCLMSIGAVQVSAQAVSLQPQVLSSSGDVSRTNQASLDWTLGQTGVTTLYTDQRMLTQGFQQGGLRVIPIQSSDVATKPELLISDLNLSVFPNPTPGEVTIRAQAKKALSGSWHLTDAQGNLLQSRTLELSDYADQIDLSGLPAGTYILHVLTDEQTVLQSYQIIKID